MIVRLSVKIGDSQSNTATLFINHDFASRPNGAGRNGTISKIIVSFRFRANVKLADPLSMVIVQDLISTRRSRKTSRQKHGEDIWKVFGHRQIVEHKNAESK